MSEFKTFNDFLTENNQDDVKDIITLLNESNEITEDQELLVDVAVENFILEYSSGKDLNLLMEEIVEEGILGSIFGGLTGFALGKTIGKTIAKVLGIQKGVLYDLLTSRLVGAALGSAIGKKL